jgi:DNA-binding transcriptional LysR family regulator
LSPDLNSTKLAELTPYVLLPEGHPLSRAASIAVEDLVREPMALLDLEPSRQYFLSLFRSLGLEPSIGFCSKSLEMVRGFVGHGLGYSILVTKPSNNMTYDGRALVARPLSVAVGNSRLVLATLASRALSPMALEFAEHCRTFFAALEPRLQT